MKWTGTAAETAVKLIPVDKSTSFLRDLDKQKQGKKHLQPSDGNLGVTVFYWIKIKKHLDLSKKKWFDPLKLDFKKVHFVW